MKATLRAADSGLNRARWHTALSVALAELHRP